MGHPLLILDGYSTKKLVLILDWDSPNPYMIRCSNVIF